MKNSTKIILGLLTSIIITYLLLRSISISNIIKIVTESDKSLIFLSLIIYILVYLGRAIRFKKISNLSSLKESFSIVSVHNFLNNVLPFKSGELSYPLILKKRFNIPFTKSLSDLALIRFFDIMSLGLILTLTILLSYNHFNNLLTYSLFSFSIILIIFLFIYFLGKSIESKNTKIKNQLLNKILKFVILVISNLSKRKKNEIIFLSISSIAISLFMFLLAFIIIRALGLDIPIFLVVIGGSLSLIATLIPIQGPFNLGTTELGFIFPLIAYGIEKETAIAISFGYHIITLLLVSILLLIGLVMYKFNSSKLTYSKLK